VSAAGDLYDWVVEALGTLDDLALAEQLFDARAIPSTHVDRRYCLDIQSKNTLQDRDRNRYRASHALEVRLMFRVNPTAQSTTYREALEVEQRIVEALARPARFPGVTLKYLSTSRVLTLAREYLYVAISYTAEGDVDLAALP
jgi:hypothetical protein